MKRVLSRLTLTKTMSNVPELFSNHLPAWNLLVTGDNTPSKVKVVTEMITKEYLDLTHPSRPKLIVMSSPENFETFYKNLQSIGPAKIIINQNTKINPFDLTGKDMQPTEKKLDSLASELSAQCEIEKEIVKKFLSNFYIEMAGYRGTYEDSYKGFIKTDFEEYFPEITLRYTVDELYQKLQLKPGEGRPVNRSLNHVMIFLEFILSKNDEAFKTFPYEEVVKIVMDAYESLDNRFPTLSDVASVATNPELIKRISFWLKTGPVPSFDTQENLNLTNDANIVLMDVKNEKLLIIYNLLVNSEVTRFLDTARFPKIKVYDQIKEFLKEKEMTNQITQDFRSSRVRGMAIITLTEDVMAYEKDQGSIRAIFANQIHQIFTGTSSRNRLQQILEMWKLEEKDLQGLGTTKQFDTKTRQHKEDKIKFLHSSLRDKKDYE